MNIEIIPATMSDKEFIIDCIIGAEKSGSAIISYCAIFHITEPELRVILGNILDEEIEGQEFYIPNFLIARVDNENAAAIAAWVEQENGIASNILKSNLLFFNIDRTKVLDAVPAMRIMNEINIHREENALQIECGFTVEKFRGLGLIRKLINEIIEQRHTAAPHIKKAHIIMLGNNKSALESYRKIGFEIVKERKCEDKAILDLLPGDTKILIERIINKRK